MSRLLHLTSFRLLDIWFQNKKRLICLLSCPLVWILFLVRKVTFNHLNCLRPKRSDSVSDFGFWQCSYVLLGENVSRRDEPEESSILHTGLISLLCFSFLGWFDKPPVLQEQRRCRNISAVPFTCVLLMHILVFLCILQLFKLFLKDKDPFWRIYISGFLC